MDNTVRLIKMLQDKDFVEKLKSSKSPEEAYKVASREIKDLSFEDFVISVKKIKESIDKTQKGENQEGALLDEDDLANFTGAGGFEDFMGILIMICAAVV